MTQQEIIEKIQKLKMNENDKKILNQINNLLFFEKGQIYLLKGKTENYFGPGEDIILYECIGIKKPFIDGQHFNAYRICQPFRKNKWNKDSSLEADKYNYRQYFEKSMHNIYIWEEIDQNNFIKMENPKKVIEGLKFIEKELNFDCEYDKRGGRKFSPEELKNILGI